MPCHRAAYSVSVAHAMPDLTDEFGVCLVSIMGAHQRDVLLLREDHLNVWSQPVDGGKPSQLTNFQGDQVLNFAWSHDGNWLAFARGRVTDDVVMISDLR